MAIIANLPTWLQALIFIGSWVLLGVSGLLLIHKYAYQESIKSSKHQIIALMSILSILFAVLLGFLVIVVWENYDKNADNVEAECNLLGLIRRDCVMLPDSSSSKEVIKLINQYSDLVDSLEWNKMEKGMDIKDKSAREVYIITKKVFKALDNVKLETQKDNFVFAEIFKNWNNVLECRRIRLAESVKELPNVLWITIISGCISILIFSYFFFFEKFQLHVFLTSIISFMMGLTLFLIFVLAHPFKGIYKIGSENFVIYKTYMKKADSPNEGNIQLK